MATKRILRVDASSLRESACPFKWKLIVIDGYKELILYNDTLYGLAVHLFIKVMFESGGNFAKAKDAAVELFRKPNVIRSKKNHLTEIHLLKTCITLWQDYIEKENFKVLCYPDGSPCVEIKFEYTLYDSPTLEIRGCGTIDRFGQIPRGCFCVRDWKITSSWNEKGYLDSYRLSPQLKFYVYSIKKWVEQTNAPSPLAEIKDQPIGAFIDGIFLKSTGDSVFKSSEMFLFKQSELDEFEVLLKTKLFELEVMYRTNFAQRKGLIEGTCSNGKVLCKFHDICASDDIAASHLLKRDFIQREYNPLMFGED